MKRLPYVARCIAKAETRIAYDLKQSSEINVPPAIIRLTRNRIPLTFTPRSDFLVDIVILQINDLILIHGK